MCRICDDAMAAVEDKGDGPTAFAWDKAKAAIIAWRSTLPDDAEFDGTLSECEAWSDHMAQSQPEPSS